MLSKVRLGKARLSKVRLGKVRLSKVWLNEHTTPLSGLGKLGKVELG